MAEEAEIEVPQAEPTTTADVALAAALDEARGKDELQPDVKAFFQAQTELARDQRHHMAAQFILEHKAKFLDNWSRRLKLMLQAITVAVAALAVGAVCWMAWDAHEETGLAIAPIRAPPDLAARGLDGNVLAERLQDRLMAMQNETRSYEDGAEVRVGEEQEIKLELPETGVSIGEVRRLLVQQLSRVTPVRGSVARAAADDKSPVLQMSIQTGKEPGVTLRQDDGDLDALLQQAAERVYETVSTARYARWLDQHGRREEGLAVWRRAATAASPELRAQAYTSLTGGLPFDQALVLYKRAIKLDPNLCDAIRGAQLSESALGHNRESTRYLKMAMDVQKRRPLDRYTLGNAQGLALLQYNVFGDASYMLDVACADYQLDPCSVASLADAFGAAPPQSAAFDPVWDRHLVQYEFVAVAAHDSQSAARMLAAMRPPGFAATPLTQTLETQVRIAVERGRGQWSQGGDDAPPDNAPPAQARNVNANRAGMLALAGRFAEADALVAQIPPNTTYGMAARGQIATARRDWKGADRWLALAAADDDERPWPHLYWGQSLLARGDVDGAVAKLTLAAAKGPQLPDAFEALGEALMAKGDLAAAGHRFADAAK